MASRTFEIISADDHALIRKGLIRVIEKRSDMRVVDEVDDGRELLAKLKLRAYDLLLLDITMPGPDWLSLIREIKAMHPSMPIVILTMHPEEQYAVRAFRAGASAYVIKASALNDLVGAIRKVMAGGRFISPKVAEKMADHLILESDRPPHDSLSNREYQILCMIAAGKTVGEMAADLTLTAKTISTYRSRVLKKMGLKTNAQLTDYAIHNRLV